MALEQVGLFCTWYLFLGVKSASAQSQNDPESLKPTLMRRQPSLCFQNIPERCREGRGSNRAKKNRKQGSNHRQASLVCSWEGGVKRSSWIVAAPQSRACHVFQIIPQPTAGSLLQYQYLWEVVSPFYWQETHTRTSVIKHTWMRMSILMVHL